MMGSRIGLVVIVIAAAASIGTAIDNGLGLTPPRGWRSWNQFDTAIHQDLIEAQYSGSLSPLSTSRSLHRHSASPPPLSLARSLRIPLTLVAATGCCVQVRALSPPLASLSTPLFSI